MRRALAAAVMLTQLGAGSSSTSGPVSPSVIATAMCVTTERGVGTLELLVLWRGSPGWFWRDQGKGGSGSSSSGGGIGGPGAPMMRTEWISQGGVTLNLRFDPTSGRLWILDQEIPLNGANVVLVDGVDEPGGPRVAGTVHIEPSFDSLTDMPPRMSLPAGYRPDSVPAQTFILRSPELVSFLRCDLPAPNVTPYQTQALDNFCSWVAQP
jgi:hypothetical protein